LRGEATANIARHGNAARNSDTRLLWPVDGLGITMVIPQQIQTLA